jgi:hypothetical protein
MTTQLFWVPDLDCTGNKSCSIELAADQSVIGFLSYCPRHDANRGQGRSNSEIADEIRTNMRARNPAPQGVRNG